jgi:hypothetical protein
MATAYVSPAGSAAYPGTVGAPTSLATALSSAGAGDIVYLAPGSYRGTFTLGVSGTAGNTIQFIGDPLGTQNIGGIAAGIVRITNYLVDNVNPTDAVLFTAVSRSYWSFTNIYFDAFRNGSTLYAFTLTTSTNWSFDKCAIVSVRSRGAIITTTANVALNASFTKCIFGTVPGGYAMDLNMPNHSGNYNVSFSLTDCISTGSIIQSFNGSPGTSTNAGGITIYNCYSPSGTCVQLYQSNTTHPTYVYNSILNSSGNAIISSAVGAVIENYNVVIGSTFSVTAGANSFYAGAIGLDYGYSAIVGLPAPSVNGPYLGSRLLGAGTATGAPATDIDGVAWYQSLLGMGAYTYAARNNVIAFPLTPTQTTITVAPASTSQSIELYLGATGLTFATFGLAAYYVRNQSAPVAITLVTQTATGAWTSGGFAEISSTFTPGVYRLDVPDAAFAAGASDVTIVVRGASGTNGAVLTVTLSSGGLTAAQTAAAVLDAVGSSYVTAGSIGYSIQNSNVASISGSTAAADELEGALLHNGTDYISAELVTPVTSAALVRMGPFEVRADGLGASDPLDIQKGAQHGIDIQCVDNNGAGIDITSATVTAKVYNSGATLVDTYSCTATYAADGRAQFVIDTTVTNTPGTYTATITRTTGASDTQVFGPLRIYVRDI